MSYRYVFSFVLIMYGALSGFGQGNTCDLEVCNDDLCGSVFVSFSPSGANVFCENAQVVLENTSSTLDFELFYIDWGDGTIDTVDNYNDVPHDYNFQNIDRCAEGPTFNQTICVVGVKTCAEGISCNYATTVVTVRVRPVAIIDLPDQLCITDSFSPGNSSCNGSTYFWDFGDGTTSTEEFPEYQYDTPGFYTVSLEVTNSCGTSSTSRQVEVVGEPEAAFAEPSDDLCAPSVISFEGNSNEFSFTRWEILPADTLLWCFTDTTQTLSSDDISVRFKQPGDYTVRLRASNVCGEDMQELDLTLGQAPLANLSIPPEGCEELVLTPADLNPQISEDAVTIDWTFVNGTPNSASGPDFGEITFAEDGKVRLTVTNSCGSVSDSVDVRVFQRLQPVISALPDTICAGSGPQLLSASIAGGVWSVNGIDLAQPEFNPADYPAGANYTIGYRVGNAACLGTDERTVHIAASTQISFPPPPIPCEDSDPVQLTATPAGGTWDGAAISTSGLFDPVAAGIGLDTVVYRFTDQNGCDVMAEYVIEVEAFPSLDLLPERTFCRADQNLNLAEEFALVTNPDGGTLSWSGPGIVDSEMGLFNVIDQGLSIGNYTIYLTYQRNQCTVRDSVLIRLTNPQQLSLSPPDTSACRGDGTLVLTASPPGGTWFGPGIDPTTGVIDLDDPVFAGGLENEAYRYEFEPGTTCALTGTVTVDVIDVGADLTAGPDIELCAGEATYQLTGQSPAGGTWEGTALLDVGTGSIDLSQLQLDSVYTYTYCRTDQAVADCSACASRTLVVYSNPDPAFTITGSVCIGETFTLTADSSATSCEWDLGDGTVLPGCSVAHSYAASGTYTIRHRARNAVDCPAETTRTIEVIAPPAPAFTLDTREGCAPLAVTATNQSTGVGINSQWLIAGDTIVGVDPGPLVFDSVTQDTFIGIELIVTNTCAERRVLDSVLVRPYPLARIGTPVDDGCSPLELALANPTFGNPDYFLWDLGNGQTSTDSLPPPQVYTTGLDSISEYTIRLIAGNECGIDTVDRVITVFPPDVQAFIGLDTIADCGPVVFRPESFSTPGSFLRWTVLTPTGDTLSVANRIRPEFTLTEPGLHTIILEAARCGADRDTAYFTVLPAPEVGFTAPPTACLGESVTFQNQSPTVSSVLWDFGDGTTSEELSPTHRYDSAGVFTVTLTVNSPFEECPASLSREITVTGLPTAGFVPSDSIGCPGLTIDFANTSTGAQFYEWNFGRPGAGSVLAQPAYRFDDPGEYRVRLVTADGNACFSDTAFYTIRIQPAPVAGIESVNERFCVDHDSLRLRAMVTGEVTGYAWTVGTDSFFVAEPVTWIPEPGGVGVRLEVANTFGCRDTATAMVEYLPSARAVANVSPVEGCQPAPVRLQDQSQFATQRQWLFGDGGLSTASDTTYVYRTAGIFTPRLIVRTDNGCPADTASATVTVFPKPALRIDYSRTDSCGTPAPVQFSSMATGVADYAWTFGDGAVSDLSQPEHRYTAPGTYPVQLIGVSDRGCADTAALSLDVFGAPQAGFALVENEACQPAVFRPVNLSTTATGYRWYLDGELVSEEETPEIMINAVGTYELSLVATYGPVCRDSFFQGGTLRVLSTPVAGFEAIPDESETLIGEVRFRNLSTGANRYRWLLGDGTELTTAEFTHEYDRNGPLEVTLYAYRDSGGPLVCVDSLTQTVTPERINTFYANNAMSPDYGEPLHRVFRPVGLGIDSYEIRVFSAHGEQVWFSDAVEDRQPAATWDGYYRGQIVPQGVYYWQAEVHFRGSETVRIFNGELHVVR